MKSMRNICFLLLCLLGVISAERLLGADVLEGLTPRQMLIQARSMFPQENFVVTGSLVTAEVRGKNEVKRPYTLKLDWADGNPKAECKLFRMGDEVMLRAEISRKGGAPSLSLYGADGAGATNVNLNTPIGESDLTWMDLAFDYLWWTDARQLTEYEIDLKDISTRVSGRSDCVVLEVKPPRTIPGLSAVRLWLDRGTGSLLQTEQIAESGEPIRQMFVQRIGRENGRWVPREFRVRRLNHPRITRLLVSSIRSEQFTSKDE